MARPVKRFLGRYVYSPKVGRYYRRTDGRLVPPSEIIKEVDRVIARQEDMLTSLGEQLEAGEITLRQWQLAVRDQLKMVHTASAATARGGLRRLDASARRELERLLKPQLQYLRNFALQVDAGAQALDGNFYRRLRAYARAARNTYLNSMSDEMKRRGVLQASRVLSIAEHCEPSGELPGCVELSDLGFVPIEELVPIGGATCRYNCKCRIVYLEAIGRAELTAEGERIKKYIARQVKRKAA